MGKITTPKYSIEYRDQQGWHMSAWRDGRVSDNAAEAWRVGMNKSFQGNGSNAHIAPHIGFVPHISHVRVVRQSTGDIVATATMPMFEVA